MTAELPVWVFGRCRWVSGVCRRTTCQDVLEAVLAAPTAPAAPGKTEQEPGAALGAAHLDPAAYVIVERWKGVERRLDGRVRILKVWSAWGEAQSEVQLQVRRVSEKGAGRAGSIAGSRKHRKQRSQRPGHRPSPTVKQHDKEEVHRLMRLILAQGETIAGQLRRLREREAQIERLESEAHRQREAQHGKDYVLAAYLKEQEPPPPQACPQDTPKTSRQPGSRLGGPGGIRPRQLAEEELANFADESEAEHESPPGGVAKPSEPANPEPPGELGATSGAVPEDGGKEAGEEDLRARIGLWEKVVKVNKRLEQQEERLVRLYVGFRRSTPDGAMAVDDREQLRASLGRLQQDIDDGRKSLEANAELLTETEALLESKRRLLRRLLTEMEAADMDTERLLAARDVALRDQSCATLPPPPAAPQGTSPLGITTLGPNTLGTSPLGITTLGPNTLGTSPLGITTLGPNTLGTSPLGTTTLGPNTLGTTTLSTTTHCGSQVQANLKGHDNDSNSDTGLSSLHSSSEEGVYILDTLV